MHMQEGFKTSWPAIAFVPQFILGVRYLLQPARQKLRAPRLFRTRQLALVSILGLLLLAAAEAVSADPAAEQSRRCEAATAREAGLLADSLYEKRDYQRAGQCYEAAGDLAHANLAFLKAAGPRSEAADRQVKAQSEAARTLLAGVGRAFKGAH